MVPTNGNSPISTTTNGSSPPSWPPPPNGSTPGLPAFPRFDAPATPWFAGHPIYVGTPPLQHQEDFATGDELEVAPLDVDGDFDLERVSARLEAAPSVGGAE